MNTQPQRPDARFASDEAGLGGVLANLRAVLIPQETLEAWAVQRRLFALVHRRITDSEYEAIKAHILSGN